MLFIMAFTGAISFPWTYARALLNRDTLGIFPLMPFLQTFFKEYPVVSHIGFYVLDFYIVLQSPIQLGIYVLLGIACTLVSMGTIGVVMYLLARFVHFSIGRSSRNDVCITGCFFLLCNVLAFIIGYGEATVIPTIYWGYLGICSNLIFVPYAPYKGQDWLNLPITRLPSPVFTVPWAMCWVVMILMFASVYYFP